MSSTTGTAENTQSSSPCDWTNEDSRALKWLGWALASTLLLSWAGWVSATLITNTSRLTTIEQRTTSELMQIQEDLHELKADVKQLLRRDNRVASQ